MEKRIKENELKNIIEVFQNKNLKIEIFGAIEEKNFLENAVIYLEEKNFNLEVVGKKYKFSIDFGFVEEISYLENKILKFKLENELEIIIKIEK